MCMGCTMHRRCSHVKTTGWGRFHHVARNIAIDESHTAPAALSLHSAYWTGLECSTDVHT